jgi:hypothetical protein
LARDAEKRNSLTGRFAFEKAYGREMVGNPVARRVPKEVFKNVLLLIFIRISH